MREISAQVKATPDGVIFLPYTLDDKECAKEFQEQLVMLKVYGVKKPRSLKQLAKYQVLCRKVAANSDNTNFKTAKDVDFWIRVELKHFDLRIVNGHTVIEVRSIAFKNLDHVAANGFFDRAFELMADWLGITVDELLENSV